MPNEQQLLAIGIAAALGLALGLVAAWLHRRRVIGRLGFLLLAPLLVLVPISWPLAAALSFGGGMEQVRCAFAVVVPLAVAVWLLARLAGWDVVGPVEAAEEEE